MCYSVTIKPDLRQLEKEFGAHMMRDSFAEHERKAKADPKHYKSIAEHQRIYPNYYAPVIVIEKGKKVIKPMRYRLRPSWAAEEIPSKFNVFNARIDSLEERRSWKPIFMKRHGIIVFERFYEWVEDPETGKKKVISFQPEGRDEMWAPVLWDRWTDGKETLESFAIITRDPPPEISMMGRDRCPVFIHHDVIDLWLHPERSTKDKIYKILNTLEKPVHYGWLPAVA